MGSSLGLVTNHLEFLNPPNTRLDRIEDLDFQELETKKTGP